MISKLALEVQNTWRNHGIGTILIEACPGRNRKVKGDGMGAGGEEEQLGWGYPARSEGQRRSFGMDSNVIDCIAVADSILHMPAAKLRKKLRPALVLIGRACARADASNTRSELLPSQIK